MSSSNEQKRTGSVEIAADQSSAGFRKWSRNLSAQRHRELNRLNQIEIRRQYLELRKQNDLFAQISMPNDAEASSSNASSSVNSTTLARDSRLGDEALAASEDFDKPVGSNNELPISGSAAIDNSADTISKRDIEQIDSRSSLDQSEGSDTEVDLQLGADSSTNDELANKLTEAKTPKDSNDIGSNVLETEQLTRFVSSQVPRNKRVLCLIVRDKVSRLNKAKSYFYPTYYLFLQAIVDIDGNASDCSNNQSPVMCSGQITPESETKDLIRHPNSTEDSFSASSSISADMLLMGSPANGTGVQIHNQHTSSSGLQTSTVNSYSDIEAGLDETDDNESESKRVTTDKRSEAQASGHHRLEGRDSPLVHPDTHSISGTVSRKPSQTTSNRNALSGGSKLVESAVSKAQKVSKTNNIPDGGKSNRLESMNVAQNELHFATDTDLRHYADKFKQQADLFDNDCNPYTGTVSVLLAGRRRKKAKTYFIGLNESGHTRKNNICKLKSNVFGTQFNAIRRANRDNDDRYTITSIIYETNVLGFKGPRKMRVFLAKDGNTTGAKNLPDIYKKDPSSVIQLKNMAPAWNIESQSYVLNFHGRVTQASVKNFQLIESEESLTEGQRHQPTKSGHQSWHAATKDNIEGSRKQSSQQHNNNNLTASSQITKPKTIEYGGNKSQDPKLIPIEPGSHILNESVATLYNAGIDAESPAYVGADSSSSSVALVTATDVKSPALNYSSSIVMQFGRVSNHEFTCDVTYPLSILQAFSIALSSFDSKLACE